MSNEVSRQVSIKKNLYQKLMLNAIIWSMLESPSISDYDEMENGVSKSTFFRTYNKRLNERNKPC